MRIRHGRISLELRELRTGPGASLLLLHELDGSGSDWTAVADTWPGSACALDFCGHGRSDWVKGGAYSPELLVADADAVLASAGCSAVAGAGLGAYVAFLLASARPELVVAALLCPGKGLDGAATKRTDGPAVPPFRELADGARTVGGNDARICSLDVDVRPAEYAAALAGRAQCLLLCEDGGPRPLWWAALRRLPAAESVSGDVRFGLARLASVVRAPEPAR
jgi:pimeloyl-ACP methyl ester carboxylesterase